MARALITGAAGFIGSHLTRYLLAQGDQVFGFDQSSMLPIDLSSEVRLFAGDIGDRTVVEYVLSETQPDVIYHLAGILKSDEPSLFYNVHVLGTVALFEAIIATSFKPKVLIASSSAVYGSGSGERAITERFKLRPLTHYAISKAAQEAVALHYHAAHQVPVCVVRAFNLIGPGQPPTLACSSFAQQIALAEQTATIDTLVTGNLNSQRDFVDVRDVVHAYAMIARSGKPGAAYNVSSGKAVSIKHCLNVLLKLSQAPLKTTIDPNRLQSNDVSIQIGSAARLQAHTGWKPQIPLRQSLLDLLNHWRQAIQSG